MISCRAVANILASDELTGIQKIAHGFMVESEFWPVPADLEERVLDRLTGRSIVSLTQQFRLGDVASISRSGGETCCRMTRAAIYL